MPRSIEDPLTTNATNSDGFLNRLVAVRDQGVARFVYAASNSTYGDHPGLPQQEDLIGKPLSLATSDRATYVASLAVATF